MVALNNAEKQVAEYQAKLELLNNELTQSGTVSTRILINFFSSLILHWTTNVILLEHRYLLVLFVGQLIRPVLHAKISALDICKTCPVVVLFYIINRNISQYNSNLSADV